MDRPASTPVAPAHLMVTLVRALPHLALFRADTVNGYRFISTEATSATVAWIRCHLLSAHEYTIRCEPGVIRLRCQTCGRRTRGWTIDAPRMPRAAATSRVTARALRPAANHILTARAPRRAVLSFPTADGPAGGAPPRTAAAQDPHDARVFSTEGRARIHASRNPPGAWRR